MLALLLFMLVSFVVYNKGIFGQKAKPMPVPVPMALSAPGSTLHEDR